MLLGPALTALVMISHARAQVFSPPGALGYSLAAAPVGWLSACALVAAHFI